MKTTTKTTKMNKVSRIIVATFYYLFIWKTSDLSVFTKNEKFFAVCNGQLNAE